MGKHQRSDQEIIAKYIPGKAVEKILALLYKHQIVINIKAARLTKMGDFRPPQNGNGARISINADLNPYAFLITLVHEIAHWLVWEKYQQNRKTKPHGIEWKRTYQQIMETFLNTDIFPQDIFLLLKKHMQNPKASTITDIQLALTLKKYDAHKNVITLGDLEIGESFLFRGSHYHIIKKNRTRYLCQEKNSGRKYLIHSIAEVNGAY